MCISIWGTPILRLIQIEGHRLHQRGHERMRECGHLGFGSFLAVLAAGQARLGSARMALNPIP